MLANVLRAVNKGFSDPPPECSGKLTEETFSAHAVTAVLQLPTEPLQMSQEWPICSAAEKVRG